MNELWGKKKKQKTFSYNSKLSLAENIDALITLQDKLESEEAEEACMQIVSEIEEEFKTDTDSISKLLFINKKSKAELIKLRKDYDAIEIFYLIASEALSSSKKNSTLSKLNEIITTYKFYMNTCIQTEAA